ncbi:MAG: SDR family oxidoreductase [Lachnospiraceae bacterium]|nr:SDR family oxidoreductase [Lachnospiraceae bacterium]
MNIAVITGASSGIGREFALTLKNHGTFDEVWVIARNEEKLKALQNEVPFPVRPISMDLSDPGSINAMDGILKKDSPNVKLLINASGYGKFDKVERLSMEDDLGMIDLNCRALVAMTKLILPYMHEGGRIIEVASVAAFQPIPYINVYGASKAFVLSFSRALNREVRSRGIHVMALCPFWTKTAFFDRAIKKDEETVVKKYAAMYDKEFIVKTAWKALESKKDHVVPGFKAKAQVALVKILPHSMVMSIWMKQQKLK